MTVSIYDIISANPIFTKILQHEFTGKQSFIIGRILKALNNEAEMFNKTREEMLKKYAAVNEEGKIIVIDGNVKIKEGEMANFQKEINELLYTLLEINVNKIPLDWLENLKLTPQEMLILEPFLLIEE